MLEKRYTTRIDEGVIKMLDDMVEAGHYPNRSDAIRTALSIGTPFLLNAHQDPDDERFEFMELLADATSRMIRRMFSTLHRMRRMPRICPLVTCEMCQLVGANGCESDDL